MHPIHDLKVKVTDLELLYSSFNFYIQVLRYKVFRTSLFLNSVVYLFHVWHDGRCCSKILCSTIPNPVHDFKVKVTDFDFLLKFCV